MNADIFLRDASPQPQDDLPAWLRAALDARFGVAAATALADRTRARYAELLAQPSPFVDPREQAFAAAEILPLLALYQTLLADGQTPENAETEVRRLRAQILRERPVQGLWLSARAPGRRHWLRRLIRRQVEAAFPPPTFKVVATEDSGDVVEFEVARCPYGAAVAAYGAPELLPTFCRLDEVRFDTLVSAVTCEHTPQPGAASPCRFRFCLHPDDSALKEAETYLEL